MLKDAKKRIETIIVGGAKNKCLKIGVAVSGGSDSMCLLHFCHAQGLQVIAVNIDHSTRQGESAKDSRFVAEYCKTNGIKLSAHIVDAPKIARQNKLNFEAAARTIRYEIFEVLINDGIIDVVLTAHHSADQAETVLLHALRGCGGTGLTGIKDYPNKGIYRPLIMTSKAEINVYLAAHNVPYITDKSNFDTTNDRNYLRHKVLPLLEKRFSGCTERLAHLAAALKEDEDFINSFLNVNPQGDEFFLSLDVFDKPHALISRNVLAVLGRNDISRQNISDIISLAQKGQNGDRVSLPSNITAWREYDRIVFVGMSYKKHSARGFASIALPPRNDSKLKWVIKPLAVSHPITAPIPKGKYFDFDALPKNAVIRTRKDGDILHKFDGTKVKLKEYFIDKKIPLRLRDDIPLICDGNKVLFVAGYEVSRELAVRESTKKTGELKNN